MLFARYRVRMQSKNTYFQTVKRLNESSAFDDVYVTDGGAGEADISATISAKSTPKKFFPRCRQTVDTVVAIWISERWRVRHLYNGKPLHID